MAVDAPLHALQALQSNVHAIQQQLTHLQIDNGITQARIAELATRSTQEGPKWTDVGLFWVAAIGLLVSAVLALVTGLLFYATLMMASRTSDLAADAIAASDQADLHHQEQLTPVVLLQFINISIGGGGTTLFIHRPQRDPVLANVGNGVAFNVVMEIDLRYNQVTYASTTKAFGPLGPGGTLPLILRGDNTQLPLEIVSGVQSAPNHSVADCVIKLAYTNLFGQAASTTHRFKVGQQDVVETVYTPAPISVRPPTTIKPKKTAIEWFLRL